MDEADFEGTLVLEKLAEIDKVDEFFDTIDSDDAARASALMKRAKVDPSTIALVLKKMEQSDGEHWPLETGAATATPQARRTARPHDRTSGFGPEGCLTWHCS